jgi:hypothetical protein
MLWSYVWPRQVHEFTKLIMATTASVAARKFPNLLMFLLVALECGDHVKPGKLVTALHSPMRRRVGLLQKPRAL